MTNWMKFRHTNTAKQTCQDPVWTSHEKCGEYGRNKRTKKRYVIQNKSDYAPRGRELDAGNQGKTPHHDARQQAHRGTHDHVFLKFFRDLFRTHQKRSTE